MTNAWSCCVIFSSDGPDNMVLAVNGTSFPVGSNLTMLCSAQSSPPAQLWWEIRGEPQSTKGPILEVFGVTKEQTGPYTCHAFNNHTNTSRSVTKHIVIAGELLLEMNSVSSHETPSIISLILHLSLQRCPDLDREPSAPGSCPCCYCQESSYKNTKKFRKMFFLH